MAMLSSPAGLAWRHLVTRPSCFLCSSSSSSTIRPVTIACAPFTAPSSPFLSIPSSPLPSVYTSKSSATQRAAFGRDSNMALLLEKLQIQRNGDAKDVFDVYVVGDEKAPGVVVVQEWWGVDFEIKNHAMTIAQKGYRALIPDLYRGKLGVDAEEARHLMEGLDWPGAVADISASVKWLKKHGSPKVGVTGFCMGGALTIASSVLVPEVDAAVCFYGIPPPELADPTHAKVPVQGHFGENDGHKGFADVESAKALREKLQKSGVPNEVHIYPNVGHAFMNSSSEAIERKRAVGFGDHHQVAVDQAWSRFEAWFGKYIKA